MNIYDYQNCKANFHTHTSRCRHATGEDREYVENAIKAGFKVLGFSDHAPYFFGEGYESRIRMSREELPGYVESLQSLKKEYEKEIEIKIGLETEYLPDYFETLLEEIKNYPIEYMILGQHFFDTERSKYHVRVAWTDEEHLETYVNRVITGIETGLFLYVAHPDIINYVGDEAIYQKHMLHMLNEMKKRQIPVEINVNGYREKCNYPNAQFVKLAAENGNEFVLGVDAHAPMQFLDEKNYIACMELAEAAGGKVLCI